MLEWQLEGKKVRQSQETHVNFSQVFIHEKAKNVHSNPACPNHIGSLSQPIFQTNRR